MNITLSGLRVVIVLLPKTSPLGDLTKGNSRSSPVRVPYVFRVQED